MFELSKQMLKNLKNALQPEWQPALEGPQIYYSCMQCSNTCKSSCINDCKNSCRGSCRGSCQGGCTRSCKGHSR